MLYKILLGIGVLFNITAQLFLKSTMRGYDIFNRDVGVLRKVLAIFQKPFFWLSLMFYGAGFLFYSITLSKLELSKAYPVSSVAAIVMIVMISIAFFKESLDLLKVIGLILCISGIFLIFR